MASQVTNIASVEVNLQTANPAQGGVCFVRDPHEIPPFPPARAAHAGPVQALCPLDAKSGCVHPLPEVHGHESTSTGVSAVVQAVSPAIGPGGRRTRAGGFRLVASTTRAEALRRLQPDPSRYFCAVASHALPDAPHGEALDALAALGVPTIVLTRNTDAVGLDRLRGRHGRIHLAAGIIDAHHFKRINDTCGHQAGDVALQGIARRLASTLRADDVVARYGGEEFACLAVLDDPAEAGAVFERVRQEIATLRFPAAGKHFPVTASLCVATTPGENLEAMLRRADEAVYLAKKAGRNRVVVA